MAREACADFVTKFLLPFTKLSTLKRRNLVTNDKKVGSIIWFRAKDVLQTMYKAREVVPSGETESSLLGTISNKATSVRARLLSCDVLKSVLVVVDNVNIPPNVPTGPVLDKTDAFLGSFLLDAEGNPIDVVDKVVVRLPVSLPLPYESIIKTGEVDQCALELLDDIDDTTFASFWASNINEFNEAFQDVLLVEDTLKGYLPAMPNVGHGYHISGPFVTLTRIDDDDTDLQEEVTSLEKECEDIAQAHVNKEVETLVAAATPRSTPSGMEVIEPTKAASATATFSVTNQEQFDARAKAWGATFDPVSGQISLPMLSKFITCIRDAPTKAQQRANVQSTIASIRTTVSTSRDFLLRLVEFPKLDKITLAFISDALFSSEPISTLNLEHANGIIIPMLMPDSSATAKAKADLADQNDAETALGEHASKKTKLSTKFTSVNELRSINVLLGTIANTIVLAMLYFHFELNKTFSSTIPSAVSYLNQIAELLTSEEARDWLKEQSNDIKSEFMHYVLNQVISISTCFARASSDIILTQGIISNEDPANLPTSYYRRAHSVFTDTREMIERIVINSALIPGNVFFENSKAKAEMDVRRNRKLMLDFQHLHSPRGPKGSEHKNKRGGDLTSPGDDSSKKKFKSGKGSAGFIKRDVSIKSINVPTELFNQEYKLCKANATDGEVCSLGADCKKDHSDLKTLFEKKPAKAKALVAGVDKDPKMQFINVDQALLETIRNS